MPEGTDSLPPEIEAALERLLQQPQQTFATGIEQLGADHPSFAAAIRAWADAIQLYRGQRGAASAPATSAVPREPDDVDLRPGDRVGPFTILAEVASGGMGTVFLAEQRQPVQRRVALKVIKLGMDSKAMLARFEVERQALAIMDHAAIAKVFEAGITAQGRSYFAMEYVKGMPITAYCDENRLPVEERLALFRQVCSGVQHAHQKGVIHRDLTPGNVMVTVQDGKPSPKIIDFGLARATNQKLTEKTLFTQQGMVLGTPEYMSPEQAGLSGLDVDMRTDVYALGVLLYELLTSRLPFEREELREVGYDAMCRTIREQDPPRPSTKITTLGAGESAARLRRTSSDALLNRLRGDLDWVVMKCLEKDRTRRYETVSELSADVQRHLDCEPVLARAPSLRYRLGKLAQRHRGELVAVALVVVAVFLGLAGTTTFWLDARAQARDAEQAREGEAARAREAGEQAELARSVVKFLRDDLFGAVSPEQAQGRAITVREVLDAAAKKLDSALAQQGAVRAELRRLIGEIYARLGLFDDAERLLVAAVEQQRQLAQGQPTEALATALYSLGMYYGEWARDQMGRGVELVEEAIAVHKQLPHASEEALEPWQLQLEAIRAHAKGQAAADLTPTHLRIIANARGKKETDEQVQAFIAAFQGELVNLVRDGRSVEAAARLQQELAPFLAKPAIAGSVPWGLCGYASENLGHGQRDLRLFLMTEAAALSHRLNGPGALFTVGCERNVCTQLLEAGRTEQARRLSLDAFRRARDSFDDRHTETNLLASLVIAAEKASGAALPDAVAEAAALFESHIGKNPLPDERAHAAVQHALPTAVGLLRDLARAALQRDGESVDHYARAEAMARQADRLTGSKDPRIIDTLAWARFRLGKVDEAITLATRALELATHEADRATIVERLRIFQAAGR